MTSRPGLVGSVPGLVRNGSRGYHVDRMDSPLSRPTSPSFKFAVVWP